jgi:tetratricopeptide (TPR) repeat protein
MKRFTPAILLSLFMLSACAGTKRGIVQRSIERVVTHQVSEGETWESIARDFYRDGALAEELAAFNDRDARQHPEAGSGVRVPLSRADLRRLERQLDAASIYNEGTELAAKGNYGEAVERFQKALSKDPSLLDASFNLAVTYQKLGLHVKAVTALKDLTERAPGRAAYHFALGHSLFHLGEIGKAKEAFMRTLAIDRSHSQALFSLAVVHEKLGEEDEALRCWNEFLEIDSVSVWAEEARSRQRALLRSLGRER